MSFEISTERPGVRPAREAAEPNRTGEVQGAGFEAWHLFLLLAMVGATVAVMLSRHTSPAALLLLSATVLAAGVAGLAIHRALAAFFFPSTRPRIRVRPAPARHARRREATRAPRDQGARVRPEDGQGE